MEVKLVYGWVILVIPTDSCSATIFFLFRIVDKISQTSSVAENSADAALQEDMADSDRF